MVYTRPNAGIAILIVVVFVLVTVGFCLARRHIRSWVCMSLEFFYNFPYVLYFFPHSASLYLLSVFGFLRLTVEIG